MDLFANPDYKQLAVFCSPLDCFTESYGKQTNSGPIGASSVVSDTVRTDYRIPKSLPGRPKLLTCPSFVKTGNVEIPE